MEINCSLNPNAKLAGGVHLTLIRGSHGFSTRKSAPRCKLPSAFSFQKIKGSGDGGVGCQRALASDSLNYEQWGDDLPNPLSR